MVRRIIVKLKRLRTEVSHIFSFFGVFLLLLLYPVIGKYVDEKMELSGFIKKDTMPEISRNGVLDGTWQEKMDVYLRNNMPGKNFLVKVNSQVQYSVFGRSSNTNVLVGENKQLYEAPYLNYQMNIKGQVSEEKIIELVDKLEKLEGVLENKNKELYVFITPSKVRYCYDEAPYYYRVCANDNEELAYDRFVDELDKSSIKYFDSIQYIDEIKEEFEYPLFYTTGIHWSNVLGANVTVEFNKWLTNESKYDLGCIYISEVKEVDSPVYPDADLYSTLNLFSKPDETYYQPVISVEEGEDLPTVYIRGGSFMGQSLMILIKKGLFQQDFHFENNFRHKNRYTETQVISTISSYDEIDVISELNASDILILEVNETNIGNMSWGFIDYLLENQDSLKED